MNKTKYILLAAAAVLSLSSCKETKEEIVLVPLATPVVTNEEATAYTLTFSWDKVENATQYAYELKDAQNKSVTVGVDRERKVKFKDLNDGSSYALTVWALPSLYNEMYTNSAEVTVTGTTLKVTQLATPELECQVGTRKTTVSWNEIEHADYYVYSYTNADGETGGGSLLTTSYSFGTIARDVEYEFSVYAMSYDELWSQSETATIKFKR